MEIKTELVRSQPAVKQQTNVEHQRSRCVAAISLKPFVVPTTRDEQNEATSKKIKPLPGILNTFHGHHQ